MEVGRVVRCGCKMRWWRGEGRRGKPADSEGERGWKMREEMSKCSPCHEGGSRGVKSVV